MNICKMSKLCIIKMLRVISVMAFIMTATVGVQAFYASGVYEEGTVFLDPVTGAVTFKHGLMDKERGAVYGYYNNTLNETGWSILEIHAQCSLCKNTDLMFAAGFFEGVVTAKQIYQNYVNLKSALNIEGELKKRVAAFMAQQDAWLRLQIVSHSSSEDVYWRHVSYVIAQLDGLYAGYKSVAEPQWDVDFFVVQLLNGIGDLIDLMHVLEPQKTPNFMQMTPHQLRHYLASNGHCSALIKLTPGFEDLFMSHSSWFVYASTMRIYKHYHLNVNDKDTAAFSVSFSSYPGFLESLDDFYLLSSKLVMLQTTNNIFNTSLYSLVTPESMLAWQRVRVANMLAQSGHQWYSIFSKYNSGTYNNQYMIIDLKRVVLGEYVDDDALWIVEQIPGLVVGTDQSSILRTGYFPSYNVPFHEVIFNMSGYPEIVASKGPSFSYQLAPRAKIFRRDQGNVVDLASFQDIMRYNDYQRDKYSENDPCNTICCRGDLEPSGSRPNGCYDTKVADYNMALRMESRIINGPTTSHHLKPFSWTGQFRNYSHLGLPETYNFDWVATRPSL